MSLTPLLNNHFLSFMPPQTSSTNSSSKSTFYIYFYSSRLEAPFNLNENEY